MRTIRRITVVLILVLFSFTIFGQSKTTITPQLGKCEGLPNEAKEALMAKLTAMSVESGYEVGESDYIISADVIFIERIATATAPIQYVVKLSLPISIKKMDGTIISTITFNLQGLESSEGKAIYKAITSLKTKTSRVRKFMLLSKEKIESDKDQ